MRSTRGTLHAMTGRAADVAVSTVGNAAGATVAPGTAMTKLRSTALSPAVAVPVLLAVLAYLAGRRRRH
jgi:MYXO-CTERM domain-containing protein